MSELMSKYPRLVAFLFAAVVAGMVAELVCSLLHDSPQLIIYVITAMLSSGFWTAVVGKRIADETQSCTYFRAAVLGGIVALLAILSIGIIIDVEMRLENLFIGMVSLKETARLLFIDDLATNLGGGFFVLLFLGWYLIPLGCLGGILLRALRKLYQSTDLDEQNSEAQLYQ